METKCEPEGMHFVEVDPAGTTKECVSCGVETDKPLWMHEHFCPVCGSEADRNASAAWNIRFRGLSKLEVDHSEEAPVETALSTRSTVVPTKRVLEAGIPCLFPAVGGSLGQA